MISHTLNQLWLLGEVRTGRDPQGQHVLLLQLCRLRKDLSGEGAEGWFGGLRLLQHTRGEGKLPTPAANYGFS